MQIFWVYIHEFCIALICVRWKMSVTWNQSWKRIIALAWPRLHTRPKKLERKPRKESEFLRSFLCICSTFWQTVRQLHGHNSHFNVYRFSEKRFWGFSESSILLKWCRKFPTLQVELSCSYSYHHHHFEAQGTKLEGGKGGRCTQGANSQLATPPGSPDVLLLLPLLCLLAKLQSSLTVTQ